MTMDGDRFMTLTCSLISVGIIRELLTYTLSIARQMIKPGAEFCLVEILASRWILPTCKIEIS